MSNSVATQPQQPSQPPTIGQIAQSPTFKQHLSEALPKHVNGDRMLRLISTALRKTPKLADCSQASFVAACMQLSSWGLEPDGHHAHLIPYGRDCTLVLDYKGLVKLAYQSGWVTRIHADVVYSGDDFLVSMGEVQRHTPWDYRPETNRPDSQGEVVAAYTIVGLKGGAEKHEVMSRRQIDKVRSDSKAGRSGPWVTHYDEMAKKTVFRRASKWLPLSAEMTDALQRDHDTPTFEQAPKSGGVAGLQERLGLTPEGNPLTQGANESAPPAADPEPSSEPGPPTDEELAASGELQRDLIPEGEGSGDPYYGEGG